MRRLLNWRRSLPRLAAVLVLLVAGHFLLGWAIGRLAVRAGQQSVGAKVEVGQLRLSWLGRQLRLRDLQVANPVVPMRNLVEADRCDLFIDPRGLLYKRAVIDRGVIQGVRFGTPRTTSGAVPGRSLAVLPEFAPLDEASSQAARRWLERLDAQFDREWADQFESVRLVEELAQRWPDQAAPLEQRGEALRQRTAAFEQQVGEAQANPLRHMDFLEALPDRIAAIEDDVAELSRDVEQLPKLLDADRRAIIAARRHDEQLIREHLQIDKVDANMLTAYLLQQRTSGPVADLLGWLRWTRQVVPAQGRSAGAGRHRGREVRFPGCPPVPDLLVRRLEIQGMARIGGQPTELLGTLSEVSSHPARHDRPMRLRLTARGALPLELQATIDRTGPVARDQLLVDCGSILVPKLRLGNSDELRFSIEPTTATLNISVTLEGDRLSGDIQIVQQQVAIEPQLGAGLDRYRLAEALDDSLGRLDSIATRVTLSGTLDEPEWSIWSDLGPAVAEAIDRSLERAYRSHADRLLAESQQRVDEQLAQIERQLGKRQSALERWMTEASDALEELAVTHERGHRLSLEHLGRRLPDNSLFR